MPSRSATLLNADLSTTDCPGQSPAVPQTEIREGSAYQHDSTVIQLVRKSSYLLQTSEHYDQAVVEAELITQVEFVDIDERATAFPSGGWTTRRDIEDLIPDYGPQALSATQKAKQEAVKRSQEVGKRSNISFAPGRRRDGDDRGGPKKRSRDDEARDRDRDRYRPKDRRYEADRRERDGRDRR